MGVFPISFLFKANLTQRESYSILARDSKSGSFLRFYHEAGAFLIRFLPPLLVGLVQPPPWIALDGHGSNPSNKTFTIVHISLVVLHCRRRSAVLV